jgi:hypothetical protein
VRAGATSIHALDLGLAADAVIKAHREFLNGTTVDSGGFRRMSMLFPSLTMRNSQNASSRRDPTRSYSAEKARQGYIALNTPARRVIFFGGLIAFVLLAVILAMLSVSA